MKATQLLLSAAICIGVAAQQPSDGPTVRVANGTLQGRRCASTQVNAFLSIPYAQSPIGSLRFASPRAFDLAYNGMRDASTPAPACPQFSAASAEWTAQSEDW
jgi:carboxylesterase type B